MNSYKCINEDYIIKPNEFLKRLVKAHSTLAYLGYGKPQNPNFINVLKNTFNKESENNLNSAKEILMNGIEEFLNNFIRFRFYNETCIVCTVPRSKANDSYSKAQLGFTDAVHDALYNADSDGLYFKCGDIIRHTDTKTTHLSRNQNIKNDGDMPYSGITLATCNFSDNIKGNNILLIDDIYTKTVNVVEDCIQALFEKGAKDVFFYSVAKTEYNLSGGIVDADFFKDEF